MGKIYKGNQKNMIVSNHQIKFDTLRVIGPDRAQLGIMSREEALDVAK